jgi:hypothetical protein
LRTKGEIGVSRQFLDVQAKRGNLAHELSCARECAHVIPVPRQIHGEAISISSLSNLAPSELTTSKSHLRSDSAFRIDDARRQLLRPGYSSTTARSRR